MISENMILLNKAFMSLAWCINNLEDSEEISDDCLDGLKKCNNVLNEIGRILFSPDNRKCTCHSDICQRKYAQSKCEMSADLKQAHDLGFNAGVIFNQDRMNFILNKSDLRDKIGNAVYLAEKQRVNILNTPLRKLTEKEAEIDKLSSSEWLGNCAIIAIKDYLS